MYRYNFLFLFLTIFFLNACAVKNKSFEFEFKESRLKLILISEELSKRSSSVKKEMSPNVEVKLYDKNYINYHWVWQVASKAHFYGYHGFISSKNGQVLFTGNIIWNGKFYKNVNCTINGGEDIILNSH